MIRNSLTDWIFLLLVVMLLAISLNTNAEENQAGVKQNVREENVLQLDQSQRFENQGIAINFSLAPMTKTEETNTLKVGIDAIATFKINDVYTDQPLSGLRLRAWMSMRPSEMVASEVNCTDKVKSFLSGALSKRADASFNEYLLLTLNHDKTITFVNPQVSFNATKLEDIIALPGNGSDWVLSADKAFLYVTMPDESSVAVINTATRKLVSTLVTGEKSIPRRIEIQPDGRYVWVGLDGSTAIAVIDTATNKIATSIDAGNGLHNIAFTADSRFAYVTNSTSNTVTVVDIHKLAKINDIPVGKTPIAIAYGLSSRLIYVATANGGTISAIDTDKQIVVKTISVKPGIVALRFDPSGRYALAANQIENTLYAIDSVTNSVIGSTQVVKEPDQIAFTERYAYVRGLGSEKFSLIELNSLKQGNLAPADIQAGRLPPSTEAKEINVADMIVPTPEGNAVIIANAPDRMMYYYQEGMMAPIGTFSNYKRMPHAVMVLDNSLRETAPGVYTVQVRLAKSGRFDVPLVIDQPRVVNCFQASVAESAGTEKIAVDASVRIEMLAEKNTPQTNSPASIKFKIVNVTNDQAIIGLKDVRALVFEPPGTWQKRLLATDIGDGIYEIQQIFPRAGNYKLLFEIASRGIKYTSMAPNQIKVDKGDKSNDEFIQTSVLKK